MRVDGGRLNVLLDLEGRLLSVHSTGCSNLGSLSTTPTYDAASAGVRAARAFDVEVGLSATELSDAQLVSAQGEDASHTIGTPKQAPSLHVSFSVHASPSSQTDALFVSTHSPIAGSQPTSMQGLPASSHATGATSIH